MKLFTIILLFIFGLNLSVFAQDDWSKMSPNQKIKLAKKEQKAAKKDPEYLKIMDEALVLFQDGQFDEAKEKYTAAHNRRPDNVYPMVMLQDIDVAMELQITEEEIEEEIIVEEIIEEEIIAEEVIAEEVVPEVPENSIIVEEVIAIEEEPIVEEDIMEEEVIEEAIIIEEEIAIETAPILVPNDTEIEIAKAEKPAKTETITTIVHPPKEYAEDGVYREELKEGNAKVDQITIVEKGVATVYRKVIHAWGAIYYFQNGDPIFEAEWDKLLEEIGDN